MRTQQTNHRDTEKTEESVFKNCILLSSLCLCVSVVNSSLNLFLMAGVRAVPVGIAGGPALDSLVVEKDRIRG
jgi:hypothetical protein